MPRKDQEYMYNNDSPSSNKASRQSSGNTRIQGNLDSDQQQQQHLMQRENLKNKGSNQLNKRDDKIGTEPGSKK